jgi:hypothetical protein
MRAHGPSDRLLVTHMADWRSILFPVPRRTLPGARWWNIAARSVHLAATGVLLGGHFFGAPAAQLLPFLWLAALTGAVLIGLEVYPSAHWLHQICASAVAMKLGLLCVIPFAWDYRVPILFMVVGIASAGSHAPRKIRHYSWLYRRVLMD